MDTTTGKKDSAVISVPYSDNPLLVTHFHLGTKSKLQRNLKLSSVCLSVSQLLGWEAWAITLCWLPWFWQLLTMCLVPLTFKKGGTSLSEHLHQTWGLFLLVFFLWGRVHSPRPLLWESDVLWSPLETYFSLISDFGIHGRFCFALLIAIFHQHYIDILCI